MLQNYENAIKLNTSLLELIENIEIDIEKTGPNTMVDAWFKEDEGQTICFGYDYTSEFEDEYEYEYKDSEEEYGKTVETMTLGHLLQWIKEQYNIL